VIRQLALDHLEAHVADPELRARLTPDYVLGCNRTLVSSEVYEVLGAGRPDVELVTAPIVRIEPEGVRTAVGLHELDVLVLATGFQVGEYLHGIDVVGRGGARLHDRWRCGPRGAPHAYLGMTVTEFPNLFVFYGPNTNQGGNSIILILEAQAQYVHSALDVMHEQRLAAVDVRRDVLDAYDQELHEAMEATVWSTGCHSYFIGAGGRVVTQLPHTSSWYAARTARFDLECYDVEPRT
jgi:cyclohexanone monooxygenase